MKKKYVTPATIISEVKDASHFLAVSIVVGEDANPELPALAKQTFNLDFDEDDDDESQEF